MDVKELLVRPAPDTVANGNSTQLDPDDTWGVMLDAKIDDVLLALDAIKHQGSFAGFGTLRATDFADRLGLYVEGVGNVGVPLQDEQARQLIAQCRQAPFGKGSETIVDTSVRNTWELDASQFRFYNDAWARTVDKCVGFVKTTLGITSPIIADPYKMLIYEKGAMFKAHTDTEKISGMFGTLVICLPSPHTGGEIVLRHAGQEKTYKTSEAQPSILCWYSDVHHEVLPVTSGYRWVLTYNLAISPDLERPSAALCKPQTAQLQQSLASWLEHLTQHNWDQATGKDLPHLYYLMEHEYTEASIALRGLKTTDLSRVQCLQDVSTKLDFDVFLAVLEKRQEGGVEQVWQPRRSYYDGYGDAGDGLDWHELDDIYETSISIKKLVDLDGGLLRSKMMIDEENLEENLIQGVDPFEGVKNRKEEYEGFTGNSGPTATHFYRTTIAVLVPRSSTDRFLTQNLDSRTAQVMLGQYAEKYLLAECEPARRQSAVDTMRHLATTAWKPNIHSFDKPDGGVIHLVLRVAVECREYDLFNDVLGLVKPSSVRDIFGLVKASALAGGLDVSKIKQSMLDNILQGDLEHRGACSRLLHPSEKQRNDDLEELIAELTSHSVKELENIFKTGLLKESDGAGIMNMMNSRQDYDFFKTRVLPTLEAATPTRTAFVLGALSTLTSWVSKEEFPQNETLDLLKRLSESIIAALDISKLRTEAALLIAHSQPQYSYYSASARVLEERSIALNPATLAAFTSTILTHSWDDLLSSLSEKIATQAATIPTVEYIFLWLPFLRHLLLPSTGTASPRYKPLTIALLTSYLTHEIGPEPPQDPSLALPQTRCSCTDCIPLNAFLASPSRRESRFTLGKDCRKHLHRVLDASAAAGLVTHETDRSGWSGTLVVTKVGTYAQRRRRVWEKRVETAKGWFKVLGEGGVLRTVIGDVGGEGGEVPEVLGAFLREGGIELPGIGASDSRGVKRKAEGEVEVIVID